MEKVVLLIKELGLSCENLMNWEYRKKDENGNTWVSNMGIQVFFPLNRKESI
jgi:hypothetical protein